MNLSLEVREEVATHAVVWQLPVNKKYDALRHQLLQFYIMVFVFLLVLPKVRVNVTSSPHNHRLH